ncbi:Oligosaccharyltransferase PglB [Dissulfuribacter thermophilus]|uniref:Oligosaccharyltransferase PglB n=1 Tax=Dissulfuribacter thermophilus TaxID=1156395 RepID=A0A1B9F7H0_9BACT|nr:STT3 domain-containing protein [Dissulfuribacter thermophilus]OCC15889.1 Oligosaccharyltransferase PglB [Dissulfuribacter thermophilus]
MAKKRNKRLKSGKHANESKIEISESKAQSGAVDTSSFNGFFQRIFSYATWKEALAIILIIIVGLVVRLEDLRDWEANPNIAMYKGEPLLTTFDGYYYLSLSKDIVDGTYTKVDYNRDVPTGVKRRMPPPLLSTIGAYTSILTGWSLNWIGAVLPAFLGLLLAIPLYGLGRFYGGPIMALTATLFGLLSHYYLYRSSVGWFDTDCMNVTWATGVTYCFLLFAKTHSNKRYIYFILGLTVYALFLLWWDSTPAVTTVISFVPFSVALIFFYRSKTKRELMIFLSVIGVGLLGILFWQGFDLPIRIIKQVLGVYHYITTKKVAGIWPEIGATISEQAIPSFNEVVLKTTGNKPAFFLSVAGLLWLFYKRPKDSLFLSVPIILAALSFFTAKRFLIFLAPVTALGLGFLICELWRLKEKNVIMALLAPAIVILLAWPLFLKDMNKTFWPKEPPHLIDGFVYAGEHTPKDAILWAWWDHGYPIVYWARRGTVGDGTIHGGERSSYNGIPLATNSQRLAANFMCFYAANGFNGVHKFYSALGGDIARGQRLMKEILASGPDEARELLNNAGLSPEKWLTFFFPKKRRPVYLYLDWRLTVTSYWWFWLGSWDVMNREGIHPVYRAFYNLKLRDNKIVGPAIMIDIDQGILKYNERNILLKQLIIVGGKKPKKMVYSHKSGADFEVFMPAGFGALMDFNIANSVFNTLFLRHTYDPKYFKPVRLMTPSHQIWEVQGDTL